MLVSYGFGDGGGGVNREMLEYRRRLDKMPGIPNVKTGKAGEYFKALREKVESTNEYVHTWDGELYLEYHRGTYTSQAYTKMMNRKLELLYRETEWLSTLNSLVNNDWNAYPSTNLLKGWKTILRNQFHDIIPGSSITEVYEDAKIEYKEAEELALAAKESLDLAKESENTWTVINNANWDRCEIIEIETELEGNFYDGDNKLEAQRENNKYLVKVENIPATGFKVITLKTEGINNEVSAFNYSNGGIDTPIYSIKSKESENTWTVINNANWDRCEIIEIETELEGNFYDGDNKLEAQRENNKYLVKVENIPATGFKVITLKTEGINNEVSAFNYSNGGIDTPIYSIKWNEVGQLTSIFDKENNREVLAKNQRGNVFQMFEDKPMAHEAWDIDIYYQEKMREVTDIQNIELVENGNLRSVVRFNYKYMNTTINQDMVVYKYDRRIDFVTNVDWREQKQLLKVAFPVDVRSTMATYDVQFGNVKRPTHWNTSWDMARFETVAQQWVDLSQRDYGVSLLNNCKYGHDIKDNVIRLTLLKSATHPDPVQDQGEQNFTYSLLPHTGDFVEGSTVKKAYELNQPLTYINGAIKEDVKTKMFNFNDAYILVDAIKKSEDEDMIVLRFHEYSGSKQNVKISSDYNIVSWQETNLMEKPLEDLRNESEINLELTPYEIKTVMIKMSK